MNDVFSKKEGVAINELVASKCLYIPPSMGSVNENALDCKMEQYALSHSAGPFIPWTQCQTLDRGLCLDFRHFFYFVRFFDQY